MVGESKQTKTKTTNLSSDLALQSKEKTTHFQKNKLISDRILAVYQQIQREFFFQT